MHNPLSIQYHTVITMWEKNFFLNDMKRAHGWIHISFGVNKWHRISTVFVPVLFHILWIIISHGGHTAAMQQPPFNWTFSHPAGKQSQGTAPVWVYHSVRMQCRDLKALLYTDSVAHIIYLLQ